MSENTKVRIHRFGKTINVTDQDIRKAIPQSSTSCMIADGVKHSLPNIKAVNVDLATIRFTDKKTGDRYTYSTPSTVQEALVQFDAGHRPKPFQFRLRTLFQIRPKANIARKTPNRAPTMAIIEESAPGEPGAGVRAPVKIGGRTVPRAALGHTRRFGRMSFPTKLEEPPESAPLPSVLIIGEEPK